MPIYAYRCSSCGFTKDVLQKLSAPALSDCPSCGESAFAKQLTAAGFQLKGSGWYATDFKGSGSAPAANGGSKEETTPSAAATEAAAPAACRASCACHP